MCFARISFSGKLSKGINVASGIENKDKLFEHLIVLLRGLKTKYS